MSFNYNVNINDCTIYCKIELKIENIHKNIIFNIHNDNNNNIIGINKIMLI